jgi:ClpP class serine protease
LEALTYRTDELATDVGAIIDGNEAVSLGLIDELGGLSEAMEYLKNEAKRNAEKESNIETT